VFHERLEELPDTLCASDVEFGGSHEESPLIVASANVLRALKAEKITGVIAHPAPNEG